MKTLVRDTDLSNRAKNVLITNGCLYEVDIFRLTYEKIIKLRGAGAKTIDEILNFIKNQEDQFFIDGEEQTVEQENCLEEQILKKIYNYLKLEDCGILDNLLKRLNNENCKYVSEYFQRKEDNCFSKNFCTKIEVFIKKKVDDLLSFNFTKECNLNYANKKYSSLLGYLRTRYSEYENVSIDSVYEKFLKELEEIKQFDSQIDYNTYNLFYKLQNNDRLDINELILLNIKESLKDKYLEIYKEKQDRTLQSVADQYNLTRERVRQIVAKTIKVVNNAFAIYVQEYNMQNVYFYSQNNTILSNECYKEFLYLFEERYNYEKISYNEDVIYISSEYFKESKYEFEIKIYNEIKRCGFVDKQIFDELTFENELKCYFINQYNFKIVDDKIISHLRRDVFSIYFTDNKILDLSDENIYKTIALLKEKYDYESPSIRALRARAGDVGNPIGGNKFCAYDDLPVVPEDVLSEIKEIINKKRFVYATDIYIMFKNRISNLYSATHLYCYFKIKFYEKYDFGGANLAIALKGEKTSMAAKLFDYLNSELMPIDKNKIMIDLEIDNVLLSIIDGQDERIVKHGKNHYYIKSKYVVNKDDIKVVEDFLAGQKRFSIKNLFTYLFLKNKEFLERNFIWSDNELFTLVQNIDNCELDKYEFDKTEKEFIRKEENFNIYEDFSI